MNRLKKMLCIVLAGILLSDVIIMLYITNVFACSYCTAQNVVSCCDYQEDKWDCCPGPPQKYSDCAGVVSNQHNVPHSTVTCSFLDGLPENSRGNTLYTHDVSSCHTAHLVYISRALFTKYECGGETSGCGVTTDYNPPPEVEIKMW